MKSELAPTYWPFYAALQGRAVATYERYDCVFTCSFVTTIGLFSGQEAMDRYFFTNNKHFELWPLNNNLVIRCLLIVTIQCVVND